MKESDFYEWLEAQPIEDKIVSIKYKYSHEKEWTQSNEILEVDPYCEEVYVWLNDWNEGQQDIEILGCIPVSDINVSIFDRKTEQTERSACDTCFWYNHGIPCGIEPSVCKREIKDEPQAETEIAKAIVHKMIDDAVIAEDAYPNLRQKMHDAVDEYEPQPDCPWK